VDVGLAVASKRDHRNFDAHEVPEDVVMRILDAGRLTGSARNRQPWEFVLARRPQARAQLAKHVSVPAMVMAAPVAVAIVVDEAGSAMSGFDAGRAAQNIMLAAWGEGVASCPNGIVDRATARASLGISTSRTLVAILALGYPLRPRDPNRRSAAAWSAAAHRRPLTEIVREL
jgi:nitroreductase